MDDIPILVKTSASFQVHTVIALSSTIWVTVMIAKKATKIKNQGSYLEVFCIIIFGRFGPFLSFIGAISNIFWTLNIMEDDHGSI